jgi:hypothetical protein
MVVSIYTLQKFAKASVDQVGCFGIDSFDQLPTTIECIVSVIEVRQSRLQERLESFAAS